MDNVDVDPAVKVALLELRVKNMHDEQIELRKLLLNIKEIQNEHVEMWQKISGGWKLLWIIGGIGLGLSTLWRDLAHPIKKIFGG